MLMCGCTLLGEQGAEEVAASAFSPRWSTAPRAVAAAQYAPPSDARGAPFHLVFCSNGSTFTPCMRAVAIASGEIAPRRLVGVLPLVDRELHFADGHLAVPLGLIGRRLLVLVRDTIDADEVGVKEEPLELFQKFAVGTSCIIPSYSVIKRSLRLGAMARSPLSA